MTDQQQKPQGGWMQKLKSGFGIARESLRDFFKRAFPGERAFRGAGIGIGVLGYLVAIVMAVDAFLPAGWVYFLIVLVLFPLAYGLGASLVILVLKLILKLPEFFLTAFALGFLLAMTGFGFFDPPGLFMGGVVAVAGALLGASVYTLARGGWKNLIPLRKGLTVAGLVLGLAATAVAAVWLLHPGRPVDMPDSVTVGSDETTLMASLSGPATRGPYTVATLTYGSGTDKRRPEFAESAEIVTESVDGSAFVSNWTGLRTMIWGFDSSALPLNGRVWYPEGRGPYPLALVVHGNHLAEDYSDPGYAYLCELLASRGTICVSVDQNFINGSAVGDLLGFNGLKDENDLRGWLLLEHLALWEGLNKDPITPFHGMVDLSRVALIGHSRGGEAVAIAAAFNTLSHYPDDATVSFDYGYGIEAVVAIAPVDRQYQPASEPIPLQDVNYLVLQGSHDMDVRSFDGYNAYERVAFRGEAFRFKSSLYIWGANHGQFNSVWGDSDTGTPSIWLYNRGQLIPAEDQMRIAQVSISAFIETTLHGEMGYLPFFQDPRNGANWLPETVYINAYADSRMDYWVTYDEDIDVTTGSVPFIHISTDGFEAWREDRVPTKWGTMHTNSAVLLGWDEVSAETVYRIRLEAHDLGLMPIDQLILSAAQTTRNPGGEDPPEPADFTIQLEDRSGNVAALPLSAVAPLQPGIEAEVMKLAFLSKSATYEPVFQTYMIDLADFVAENPDFNPAELRELRLVFDRTPGGEIWLDNLGIRWNEDRAGPDGGG